MKLAFLLLGLSLLGSTAQANVGDTRIGVAAPLMIYRDDPYWGANLSVYREYRKDVEFGLESGFFFWPKKDSNSKARSWVVPIVPTILYNLDTQGSTSFTPFVGFGLGGAIIHTNALEHAVEVVSETKVKVNVLAHVGAKFGGGRNFFIDLKIGMLDGEKAFHPSIGWFF